MITEIQTAKRTFKNGPPWLLNIDYIESFELCGLNKVFQSITKETKNGEEIHLTIFKR